MCIRDRLRPWRPRLPGRRLLAAWLPSDEYLDGSFVADVRSRCGVGGDDDAPLVRVADGRVHDVPTKMNPGLVTERLEGCGDIGDGRPDEVRSGDRLGDAARHQHTHR